MRQIAFSNETLARRKDGEASLAMIIENINKDLEVPEYEVVSRIFFDDHVIDPWDQKYKGKRPVIKHASHPNVAMKPTNEVAVDMFKAWTESLYVPSNKLDMNAVDLEALSRQNSEVYYPSRVHVPHQNLPLKGRPGFWDMLPMFDYPIFRRFQKVKPGTMRAVYAKGSTRESRANYNSIRADGRINYRRRWIRARLQDIGFVISTKNYREVYRWLPNRKSK